MEVMRESAAHWIMMHEHPFNILEEVGFNIMMKRGMPEWRKISISTNRSNCLKVYELEKKKLKHNLESVSKICDAIFRCMKDWGIEKKVFTITVDNATSNDSAIRYMKDTLQRSRSLVCGGRLFHVRCCAHILNLCVQDGLDEIRHVIRDVRDSVEYVNRSEARRIQFADCVQQLQLKDRKLIRDCKTRWNSTFEMLSCALKFKEAFKMLNDRDPFFDSCCGYPTSNLFLQEVQKIKAALDSHANDEDSFIKDLVGKMKMKFDKYWGECNLLMAIGAVFYPTKKMLAVEFCFPRLYSDIEAKENISKVKEIINTLYEEYVAEAMNKGISENLGSSTTFGSQVSRQNSTYDWDDFDDYCAQVETSEPKKSELADYLEKRPS
ncbi:PREDICTED: zinc finger BED domain-containing protein RICESLEEPER 2-like [Ipomoea nil]|uniref:zinc finger BED domain-containing protein RICESLEEPER 2-like n=1 Tax=Ipomoea nil TaxID=35883 RepID=UPI000901E738|nr:PREDICTED: zinc finger BED domain-containing protein RICESLEEPER 2-like [Ipomoea nil]